MIQTWQITPTQNIKLDIEAATLDDVTRRLPDGYYSTFRTFDRCTRVLGFMEHLRRLYEPVPAPEVDETSLRRALFALLEPYRPGEARVRAVMTKQGQAFLALSLLALLPRDVYEEGVRVETTSLQRLHPRLKSTSFISRSEAERNHITQEGIFEALLVKDGVILEGMTSNFFFVRAEQSEIALYTARNDILLGITRQTVIDLAGSRAVAVREQPLGLDELGTIREAFLTSSSRGIVPIVQIDDVAIGQGSPGPLTRELMAAYDSYVLEKAEAIYR